MKMTRPTVFEDKGVYLNVYWEGRGCFSKGGGDNRVMKS
jgi:hypothetical protein